LVSINTTTLPFISFWRADPSPVGASYERAVDARSQNCEKRLLALSCLSVRSNGQLGCQWTDFRKILLIKSFFRKFGGKIQG
jgi:hypothetical protein